MSPRNSLNSRSHEFAIAIIGWPFELPKPWRRAWLVGLPITGPIWLIGVIALGFPAIFFEMFNEIRSELWD